MDHSAYWPSQCETMLYCKIVSHWPSPHQEWSLHFSTDTLAHKRESINRQLPWLQNFPLIIFSRMISNFLFGPEGIIPRVRGALVKYCGIEWINNHCWRKTLVSESVYKITNLRVRRLVLLPPLSSRTPPWGNFALLAVPNCHHVW